MERETHAKRIALVLQGVSNAVSEGQWLAEAVKPEIVYVIDVCGWFHVVSLCNVSQLVI